MLSKSLQRSILRLKRRPSLASNRNRVQIRPTSLTHFLSSNQRCLFASTSAIRSKQSIITPDLLKTYDESNPECNIPPNIISRVGTNLHLQKNHPLNTIKIKIEEYWQQRTSSAGGSDNNNEFATRDNLEPIVPIVNNFDSLLIPKDHVSRSKSDTYYVDKEYVLRTHTSAHQTTLMNEGLDRFLVTGDVYR